MIGPPFHAGEMAVQARAGVRAMAERSAATIRAAMPDQHRELFARLPYLVVGAVVDGQPFATFLAGTPGFVETPDATTIMVAAEPAPQDPTAHGIVPGAPIGVLGIQLETRRRNRANGYVQDRAPGAFTVHVEESFGNCPRYIQARTPVQSVAHPPVVSTPERGALSPRARAIVERADTLFIASEAEGRVDVSHRGGRPGFVRVEGAVLTLPDFSGNAFFMTLGNLEQNPRAGIAIVDFSTGALLSLTGTTETIWDGAELASFTGAERLLRITVEHGVLLEHAIPFTWSDVEPARQIASTGAFR